MGEAYGEGQRQIGELQTAQGFLTGNVPEFQEGLVNQAIGPYVSGYGSYLKSTYGGRKLLIGEGLASLGQGMQQLGQAQAGLAFVGKDRPAFDKGWRLRGRARGSKSTGTPSPSGQARSSLGANGSERRPLPPLYCTGALPAALQPPS